jgi:hypothetical protein
MFCSQVLASADAELFKKKPNAALPTVDDMDAGTFARALASAAGRKGGRTTAKMVTDFNNPAITQPKQIADKTEKMLGGMGGHTVGAHTKATVEGGGSPTGGYDTAQATDAHKAACVAGGGSPTGGYDTAQATDAHKKAIVEGIQTGVNQKAIIYAFAGKGLKIFRTCIVCEGVEHEFFTSCALCLLHTVNCFFVTVTSDHGRLFDILDEGDGKIKRIEGDGKSKYLFTLPHSNATVIDQRGPDMLKAVRGTPSSGGSFSRGMIKVMKTNLITWTTAEYQITAEMLAVYLQEKKEKQRLAKKRKAYK